MSDELNVIIDDDLYMDVNTSTVKSGNPQQNTTTPTVDMLSKFDEIDEQLDHIEVAIYQLEESLTPQSVSYYSAGVFVNIVIGIVFALIIILLII